MISDILIPFLAIALAELGDKTQLSVLLLSMKARNHLSLLLGVMLAFLLVDGFAIVVGSWITRVIPLEVLKVASGAVFILFGLLILRELGKKEESEDDVNYDKNPFVSGFLLIFMAEWGDKTQIASALFATKYDPWLVLVGMMAALGLLSVTAVYLGRFLIARLDKRLITKVAGVLFILMGLSFLAL
ncbi:MAG: TMEM165/GDT1 family protein [Methanosarcinales archaeon]|nr:TMEM165/GDT1 family protein [Methanosarcinales archaeon]